MAENDISIIIPTYNRAVFLNQVLKTYVSQKHVLEIIIIDDGSQQNYSECLKRYKHNDKAKIIYKKLDKNHGQAFCRNYGINKASGKYIMMGEDDVFLDNNYCEILRYKIIEAKKKNLNIFICGNIFYNVNFDMSEEERNTFKRKLQNNKTILFDYKNFFGAFEQYVENDTAVPFGHALIMVDRDAYNPNTYYENYKANSFREESDGQIQLTRNNFTGYITSDTSCYHLPGILTHESLTKREQLLHHINFMKSNRIFWNRNYEFFKEKYDYSYPKILPIISHDYRDIKAISKTLLSRIIGR